MDVETCDAPAAGNELADRDENVVAVDVKTCDAPAVRGLLHVTSESDMRVARSATPGGLTDVNENGVRTGSRTSPAESTFPAFDTVTNTAALLGKCD